VLVSLENLMSFPFVREAVEGETMSIHGLWNDIGDGSLLYFDPEYADWRPVE
jgi:carbonic anhydrase